MKMILIKNEKIIDKMSSEKRNKYLQKLESRREVVYDELLKFIPKEQYKILKNGHTQEEMNKSKFLQKHKKKALVNELHDISNAIWHIRYLNRQEIFKRINESQDYEREF